MLSNKIQIFAFAYFKPGSERARLILFFAFLFLFSSCDFISKNGVDESLKGKMIATVYDQDVYESDIFNASKKDSVQVVDAYLDDIATKEALFIKANESDLVDNKLIEIQTERFRKSLISAHFEREYVKQKLDTNIKEEDLKQYFKKNGSIIPLRSAIFKGYYLVLPTNSNKIIRLKELLQSEKAGDVQELKNFCVRYANSYSLDSKNWTEMPILLSRLFDFNHEGIASVIKNKQLLAIEKDDNFYFLRLFDFKFANQPSPYSYVKRELKQLLLNEREAEIISKLKLELLSDAKASKKIQIY